VADRLFDTTFFIDFYHGDAAAVQVMREILSGEFSGSYSPVSVFEVWLGLSDHEEEITFRGIFGAFESAPLTDEASRTAAIWLRGVSPRRAEIVFRDAMIAATAATRSETIVTRNVKDFERFGVDVETY
jgi:predicted nucleic acid-binding protein